MTAPLPKSSGPRLHHLDALRGFAILYGVFVHAATLGVSWPLTLVSDVSGYFRMGTFFLVSGFFGAMVLRRLGTAKFLQRRAIALLVPLACGLLLLNPLTTWLVWNWHNAPALPFLDFLDLAWWGILPSHGGPVIWFMHLWFLISLSFYALTAPMMVRLARALPVLSRLADALARLPGWLCVIAVAVLVALCSLVLRGFYETVLERLLLHSDWNASWLTRTTFFYWPMFLTGMAIFHHGGLSARFQSLSWPGLAAGLALVILARETMVQEGMVWEVAQLLTRVFLTICTVAALMNLFGRWFGQPGFLSRSADAVYSIYILHFLVIYLIATALRPLGLPQPALFVLVAVATIVVLFAVHRHLIRPSAVLSFVFNGKPIALRRSPAPAAPREG